MSFVDTTLMCNQNTPMWTSYKFSKLEQYERNVTNYNNHIRSVCHKYGLKNPSSYDDYAVIKYNNDRIQYEKDTEDYFRFLRAVCNEQGRKMPDFYDYGAIARYSNQRFRKFLMDAHKVTKPYYVDRNGHRYRNVFIHHRTRKVYTIISDKGRHKRRVILGYLDYDNYLIVADINYQQLNNKQAETIAKLILQLTAD